MIQDDSECFWTKSCSMKLKTSLLLGSHWTQNSPCSWSPGCSKHSGTSAGWSSQASPQIQSSFQTCRSWNGAKWQNVTLGFPACECLLTTGTDCVLFTPVHIRGLEPLGTGELHHHLGLLNGVRFICRRRQKLQKNPLKRVVAGISSARECAWRQGS